VCPLSSSNASRVTPSLKAWGRAAKWIRRRAECLHYTYSALTVKQTSANGNSALYATFAFTAFFAGSIHNKLGSRLTLLLGSLGYSLYIGSYLAMEIHPNAGGFVIAASSILGTVF